MKLVALVGLCLVTRCGITAAGVNGPEVVKLDVDEGSDVILPCSLSTKENIQSGLFDWKKDGPRDEREVFLYDAGIHYNNGRPGQSETFKGRVSHFPEQLKYGIASITIRNTRVTDSGNYTCHFPRLQPPQIFRIELIVDCVLKDRTGENIPGAAPKPSVTSLKTTKYRWRLQCEVRGAFPEPKVEWQDSDGNTLPAEKPQVSKSGDRYNVILKVTVTKTDYYRCVATQETICHQTYVYISGPKVVEDGSDVILPCSLSTKENIKSKMFDWTKDGPRDEREVFLYDAGSHYNNGRSGQSETFKGRVFHFEDQLKNGIASITIRNTKVTDSGNYTCHFPRLQPPQIFRLELIVGAAPEPSVTSLKDTKYWRLLQCKVHGNPKPKVQWQDSDGNTLPAEEPQVSKSGDRYNVILQVTVTKTDYYRCVATQETIYHQIYREIDVYISAVVEVVAAGSDVILPCSPSTKQNIQSELFDWKKDGQKDVFFYEDGVHYNNGVPRQDEQFKGRVSHFQDELKNGNASIIIRNTKVADSGDYTCDFPRLQPRQIFHIMLVVGAAPKPYVTILNPTEDGALLQCEVRGASPEPRLQWQDSDGNILHAEESQVSERGGSYDVILQVTVTKTDRYRCIATQETISHQIYTETYVSVNGAASKPSVTRLDQTEDGALLQCEIRGAFPEPLLEWQDSDGNILLVEEPQVSERGGSYDVILQVTVTKTDRYRCIATQETISHQVYTETYVSVNGAASKPSVTRLDQTEDGALLQCEIRGAFPEPLLEWQDSDGNILLVEEPQVSERGGSYDVILQVTVTKTDRYRCIATQETISHQVYTETYVSVNAATPKPSVTTLAATETWALLQCDVRGASPKPKVEWQDSAGNILPTEEPQVSERGGSYDIILQTTVTKNDRYRCVVTQETIGHQVSAEIFVHISAATPKPSVTTLAATETWELLQCDVRGASLKPKVEWQDSAGNILPTEEPQVSERGGSYDIILQTTVTKTARYRCVATQETINHQVSAETYVHISEKDSSIIIGSFFGGLLLGAVIIVAGLALLVAAKCITIRRYKGSRQQRSGSRNQSYSLVNQRNGPVDQKNGPVDQKNGPVDQGSGPVDQKNGPVDQKNGPVDQRNGPVDQRNGPVDQKNGSIDQKNGPVDQRNGPVDQRNGPVDQKNGPVDQRNGPVDQKNGPVDQKNGPVDQRNGPVDQGNGPVDQGNS
ncbi:hemicentin-1-like isoform X2 [Sebastes fasciatus]|uniref:hemicentin-1-like isoform X2 n=1 Tax=Sebastes fasciatus TaxID=394691 RepID=UPI003D9E3A4E